MTNQHANMPPVRPPSSHPSDVIQPYGAGQYNAGQQQGYYGPQQGMNAGMNTGGSFAGNAFQSATANLPDIKDIFRVLWRHRYLIILVTLIPTIFGFFHIKSLPSLYKANALVVIEKEQVNLSNNAGQVVSEQDYDDYTVQTEVDVIKANDLVWQSIQKVGLHQVAEFNPLIVTEGDAEASTPSFLERLGFGGEEETKPVTTGELDADEMRYHVLRRVKKNLAVSGRGSSRVVSIGFKSQSPVLARDFANAHAETYIQAQLAFKGQDTSDITSSLKDRIERLRQEVQDKEQAAERFRAQKGITLGRDSEGLVYEQISELSARLIPIEIERARLEGKLRSFSSGVNSSTMDILGSRIIQSLREQESIVEQRLETLKADYGPKYPSRIAAEKELATINSKIKREISKIRSSLSNELSALRRQEATLKSRLRGMEGKSKNQRSDQVQLRALEREAEASRKQLDDLLRRNKEVETQSSFNRADAQIVSTAGLPLEPSEPKKIMLLAVFVIFSGGLSLVVVFILEQFRDGITNGDMVTEKLSLPYLGGIPREKRPNSKIVHEPMSRYAEAIKGIYTKILLSRPNRPVALIPHGEHQATAASMANGHTLAITSAIPGEGKSVFSISLARYIATSGKRIAIIDTDLRRGTIHKYFNVSDAKGLSDYLQGKIALDKIMHEVDGVTIIPAGPLFNYAPEVFSSDAMQQLLHRLKQDFDIVLLDTPPVLALADIQVIAGQVDSCVYVAEWAETSVSKCKLAVTTLRQSSNDIAGVVLNKVDLRKVNSYGDGGLYVGKNSGYYTS